MFNFKCFIVKITHCIIRLEIYKNLFFDINYSQCLNDQAIIAVCKPQMITYNISKMSWDTIMLEPKLALISKGTCTKSSERMSTKPVSWKINSIWQNIGSNYLVTKNARSNIKSKFVLVVYAWGLFRAHTWLYRKLNITSLVKFVSSEYITLWQKLGSTLYFIITIKKQHNSKIILGVYPKQLPRNCF